MDISKLAELKEISKDLKGVDIHGEKIRISFYYKTVRCLETLKGIKLTKSNLKFAANKRAVILHEITLGTFDYADHFPESKRAMLFSGAARKIPLVKEAIAQWLALKQLESAHSSYTSYRSKANNHIVPKWGEMRLDHITQGDIKRWLNIDLRDLSNKTINNVLIPFRAIYAEAMSDQIIDHNPLTYISNLSVVKEEPDPFTRDEIIRIASADTFKVQEKNAFVFNCWSGLRLSELIALAWEDIDTTNWTVKIKRGNVKSRYKSTKTKGSTRTIDLIEPAISVLKSQMPYSMMLKGKTVPVLQKDNKTIKDECLRFVFLNSKNFQPYPCVGSYRDGFFKDHVKKSKVRYRPPGQARHTFASQLLTAGVNERWIAQQMGHTSLKMIEEHYGKWMKEEVPEMAKKVTDLLGFDSDRSTDDPKKKGNQPK